MEEIPEIFNPKSPERLQNHAAVPEHANTESVYPTESIDLQSEPDPSVIGKTPVQYELEIMPGIKAAVEVAQMSESDFDRHEVIADEPDEGLQTPPSGMVSLSEVLSQYPNAGYQPKTTSARDQGSSHQSPIQALPTYRGAIRWGVLFGILAGCASLALIIINQ